MTNPYREEAIATVYQLIKAGDSSAALDAALAIRAIDDARLKAAQAGHSAYDAPTT